MSGPRDDLGRADHRERQRVKRRRHGIGPPAWPDPRLDLDALRRAAGCRTLWGPDGLSTMLGVSGSCITRAREHGLTIWAADRYAIRLHLHPLEVWGDAWHAVNADRDADALEVPA